MDIYKLKNSNFKNRRKEWVIIIAQHVTGRSKFPRGLKFSRYKPYPYKNSKNPHRIVYARSIEGTEAEVVRFGNMVEEKMFQLYISSLANTGTYCVTDYTMLLHDVTTDTSIQLACTLSGEGCSDPNYLYDDARCSNKLICRWKIMRGL